jgi:hypothetical protein
MSDTIRLADLVRSMPCATKLRHTEELLTSEWLVANGLGGYASGTVSGIPTRRYHGLLVAALPAPYGVQPPIRAGADA